MGRIASGFVVLGLLWLPQGGAAQALSCPETPILVDGFETSAPGSPNLIGGDAAATLDLHNCMRNQVSPPAIPALAPLTWSTTVADSAQAWANNCAFQHQPGQPFGENLAASTGSSFSMLQGTQLWVAERTSYDYAGNTCQSGAVCGHYTQVVWRNTSQLGCGRAVCTTGNPFGSGTWTLVVCRYDPRGNFVGQRPY